MFKNAYPLILELKNLTDTAPLERKIKQAEHLPIQLTTGRVDLVIPKAYWFEEVSVRKLVFYVNVVTWPPK